MVLTSLEDMWRWAQYVVASGLAPKGFNASGVLVATQMGLELGLTPMAALQNIASINGRPGIYGDAALAIVQTSGLLEDYDEHAARWCDECEQEGTKETQWKCPNCQKDLRGEDYRGFVVFSKRRGRRRAITSGFNVRQAKQAGLWGKDSPWKTYPHRMLKFRARGFNLRDNFSDVLKGFKTTEELQDYPSEVIEHTPPVGPKIPLRPRRSEPAPSPETGTGEFPDEAGFDPTRSVTTEQPQAPDRQPGDFVADINDRIMATRDVALLRAEKEYIAKNKHILGDVQFAKLTKSVDDRIKQVERRK